MKRILHADDEFLFSERIKLLRTHISLKRFAMGWGMSRATAYRYLSDEYRETSLKYKRELSNLPEGWQRCSRCESVLFSGEDICDWCTKDKTRIDTQGCNTINI